MTTYSGNSLATQSAVPETVFYTTEQRIDFIANLVVDRIVEDMQNGRLLAELLGDSHAHR